MAPAGQTVIQARHEPQSSDEGELIRRGRFGQDGQKTNPCSIPFADQKVVPTDPSDPCGLCHMLMGEMPSLILPVDELGSGNGHGLISEVLNGIGQDEPDGIEKNVDPLIMLKIERGRSVFNVVQDGIREMVPDRNRKGMPVHDPGGEKDLFFSKGPEISHAEEGASPTGGKGPQSLNYFQWQP